MDVKFTRLRLSAIFLQMHPKYSCIVVINNPLGDYYGATVAGPVFKQIADYVYAYELGVNEDFEHPGKKIAEDYPGYVAGRKKT